MKMKYMSFTGKGYGKTINEDRVLIDNKILFEVEDEGEISLPSIAAICDGVSGEVHGEKAAEITLSKLKEIPIYSGPFEISKGIYDANREIMGYQNQNPEFRQMATTLAGLIISKERYTVFNLGDSKIYRCNKNEMQCITEEHTKMQELRANSRSSKKRYPLIYNNIITRYIGGNGDACKPYICVQPMERDLTFLICSDGINKSVSEDTIKEIMVSDNLLSIKHRLLLDELQKNNYFDDASFLLLECI